MTTEQLRQEHEARQFRPFDIHLADGRTFHVDHPEFLARSPSVRSAILYGTGGNFEVIDLLLVTSLSVGNGQLTQQG